MFDLERKPIAPFTIHLGDVFLFPRDIGLPLRVITNLREPGSLEVNAAGPSLRSDRPEYFKFFGSTHPITDLGEIVDHWDLDRIIRAYEAALNRGGFEPLGTSRDELINNYQFSLFLDLDNEILPLKNCKPQWSMRESEKSV